MGVSISKSVVSELAEAAASVISDVSITSSMTEECRSDSRWVNCVVHGSLEVSDFCTLVAASRQLVASVKSENLSSSVSQRILERSLSWTPPFAIGYEMRSDLLTTMASSSKILCKVIVESCQTNADRSSRFSCENKEIMGDVQVGAASSESFLKDQILTDKSAVSLFTTITQDVRAVDASRAASVWVPGAGAALLILFLLLFFRFSAYFRTPWMPSALFGMILTSLVGVSFVMHLPPFFDDLKRCACGVEADCQGCGGQPSTVILKNPPLRYAWPLVGTGDVTLGQDPGEFTEGLLQAAIAKAGGWTQDVYQAQLKVFKDAPPLLKKDGEAYRTNVTDWLRDTAKAHQYRFVLCSFLDIPTNVYIDPQEGTSDNRDRCYRFVPDDPYTSYQEAVRCGGSVTGVFGYENNLSYKARVRYFPLDVFLLGGGLLTVAVMLLASTVLEQKDRTS
jgi:hypothetical protein